MSHGKERKEKNCLNCNARVFGRYCHVCGQENIEPRESAWELVVHFFNDITHFEGKFGKAIRYVLFRPGFLPAEYARGRRMSYMNPVRMYVFTSAFFFIIFFSLFKIDDSAVAVSYAKLEERFKDSDVNFDVNFVSGEISVARHTVGNLNRMDQLNERLIDSLIKVNAQERDSTQAGDTVKRKKPPTLFDFNGKFESVKVYDSIQQSLPEDERDGWFGTMVNRKAAAINEKYGKTPGLAFARIGDVFLHKLPTIFFVSLPMFALILSLLYVRRRRQFNFVNHGIFSIYYYIFCFLLLLIYFAANKLGNTTGWSIFIWVQVALSLCFFIYLYKAMRNYYGQGRAKTIIKYILLNFIFFILVIFLFTGFLIFSAFNI
nr:DUF3667 domain-containing protein [uncultured Lacibacter sp.]